MSGMFLDMEQAIVDRLTTKFASLTPKPVIKRAADLDQLRDRSQGDLQVFVLYNGMVEIETLNVNAPQIGTLTNEYIVWIVARSAKDHGEQSGTRQLADPVLLATIEALMGARLVPNMRPLHITSSTLSPAYADGFGFFPLTFHHRVNLRGDG